MLCNLRDIINWVSTFTFKEVNPSMLQTYTKLVHSERISLIVHYIDLHRMFCKIIGSQNRHHCFVQNVIVGNVWPTLFARYTDLLLVGTCLPSTFLLDFLWRERQNNDYRIKSKCTTANKIWILYQINVNHESFDFAQYNYIQTMASPTWAYFTFQKQGRKGSPLYTKNRSVLLQFSFCQIQHYPTSPTPQCQWLYRGHIGALFMTS